MTEWTVYKLTPRLGPGVIAHASDGHGHHIRVIIPTTKATAATIAEVVQAAGDRLVQAPRPGQSEAAGEDTPDG